MKSGLGSMKILLVEDQTEARAMMRNMLMEFGVNQIFEAPDGREAFKFIDNAFDFIDLIICDWNMPSMTGVELLRQLRTVDPNIPFLMVTGRSDLESVVEAKSSGVTAYIRKPFSSKQLEAKLKIILHKMAA
jgi:two-component system chemotaxis response regulator CheY